MLRAERMNERTALSAVTKFQFSIFPILSHLFPIWSDSPHLMSCRLSERVGDFCCCLYGCFFFISFEALWIFAGKFFFLCFIEKEFRCQFSTLRIGKKRKNELKNLWNGKMPRKIYMTTRWFLGRNTGVAWHWTELVIGRAQSLLSWPPTTAQQTTAYPTFNVEQKKSTKELFNQKHFKIFMAFPPLFSVNSVISLSSNQRSPIQLTSAHSTSPQFSQFSDIKYFITSFLPPRVSSKELPLNVGMTHVEAIIALGKWFLIMRVESRKNVPSNDAKERKLIHNRRDLLVNNW